MGPFKGWSLVLSVSLLLPLTSCFPNDTPYGEAYSHIGIYAIVGPGKVRMQSHIHNELDIICTQTDNSCGGVAYKASGFFATFTAIPDEGHVFVGWTGDIRGNENPLDVSNDGDYLFNAIFE